MKLKGKNIVLCITGGIAAYKAIYLASFLKKQGANVYPVLTKNALKFVTSLTLRTLTNNKVTTDMFEESDFIPHISLADLADIVIVAPATANIIAKAATGIADDMVSSLLLSTLAVKIIVPAMNTNMYNNTITQINIQILKDNGYKVMKPDIGKLACGTEGEGRFPEIESIHGFILKSLIDDKSKFYNNKVLITLGGTIEDIDPVRYITNKSSGKMGFSFAEEFIERGALIKIIAGNTSDLAMHNFKRKYPDTEILNVRSAKDMFERVSDCIDSDIYLMSAAVADYTVEFSENKIKKDEDSFELKLTKTIDIIKSIDKNKKSIYIGFAAETEDLLKNARQKVVEKKVDFLIANNVRGEKSAIGGDKAEVILLNKWNEEEFKVEYSNKKIIASKILDKILSIIESYKK